MKLSVKTPAYILFLSLISTLTFSCLDSGSSKKKSDDTVEIIKHDIVIPFMAHAGSTHLHCGVQMTGLGETNNIGWIQDFRLFIHDVKVVDDNGDTYSLKMSENDWQTQGVALLSFMDKAKVDCPTNTGDAIATNMEIVGSFKAPENAVFKGLSFKIGVPFELNHGDPLEAEGPLAASGMFWNWQGGYKHMRIEARMTGIDEGSNFTFHLGSVGCDGSPSEGGVTECTRYNRPEVVLNHFDADVSAVQIDFQALVENLDVSAGGSCHSGAGSAVCQGAFDSLGLDYYSVADTVYSTIAQANEGQSVFSIVVNHD